MAADDSTTVRVALRIRPQSAKEKIDACRVCTFVTPGEPQILIGKDKSFTYDQVYDIPTQQNEIYERSVKHLVEGCFDGYNATVLAYGQTGSGKTYTMGTGFDVTKTADELGVIPRAVEHIFHGIKDRHQKASSQGLPEPEFVVSAQFMELYNEKVIDLFSTTRGPRTGKIQIHEDTNGNIYAAGVTTKVVKSAEEMMKCLQDGALNRTTGSTQMNAQSSRSHAIFSIHIKQTRTVLMKKDAELYTHSNDVKILTPTSEDGEVPKENGDGVGDAPLGFESLSAKFHFTDLAGSERLKRTGATGDRKKEGIAINCGLLALGNVISALGDPTKNSSHVPYRDSKLTRLLQDSLGGNSQTLMIACVSPSDSDFMETLNTLKYANRARNIKNKVVVNQDKASQQMQALRQQIAALQIEVMEYKTGKKVPGEECYNDMHQESTLLREENEHLRMRIKAMQQNIDSLTSRLTRLQAKQLCNGGAGDSPTEDGEEGGGMESIVENYMKEIELSRSKLVESEAMCANLRRRSATLSAAPMSPFASRVTPTPMPMAGTSVFESHDFSDIPVLDLAKKEVEKLMQKKDKLENQAILRKENKENIVTSLDFEAGEEEGEDGEESSDESEAETEMQLSESEDEESDNMQDELATLTFEIELKQNMISEMEDQRRRMEALKHQYENKVKQLEVKIRSTEEERDKILKNLEGRSGAGQGDASKVKMEYQKKLDNMKKEVGKLKDAKKSHDQLLREQTKDQQRLRKLKNELEQMKTTKVKLMKQMKEQQKKVKQQESQRLREITQLKREGRKKENQLRSLESKFRAKDQIVQRKKEEVEMLRRQLKPISGKLGKKRITQEANIHAAGNVRRSRDGHKRKQSSEYSSKTARAKWQKVEKKISDIVLQRETISHMERQMDHQVKERERLQKAIQRCQRRKTKLKANRQEVPADLKSELNGLLESMEFFNAQIEETQSEILQVEESMESDSFMSTVFETCSVTEARYLLEQLLRVVVNKSAMSLQAQTRIKELEAKLETEMDVSKQAHELMRCVIEDQAGIDPHLSELLRGSEFDEDGDSDSDSSPERPAIALTAQAVPERKVEARRKTQTPQELLHGIVKSEETVGPQLEPGKLLSPIVSSGLSSNGTPDISLLDDKYHIGHSTPTGELNEPAKVIRKKTFVLETPQTEVAPAAPEGRVRRQTIDAENTPTEMMPVIAPEVKGSDEAFVVPATPPPLTNCNVPPNVFSRLTRYALSSPRTDKGRMSAYTNKTASARSTPLVCVQVAEGHHKPVLCVQATDHLLFSGSKDRTVKIWNLVTSQEIMSLDGHPNNVNVVRQCPNTGLIYTVSLCYVKVWDIRSKAKCIKVLSSSGQVLPPTSFMGTMGRTNRMPDNEMQISDIVLSKQSKKLFSASGTNVKIWDLNRFSVVGKLSGQSGQIMTMAVSAGVNDTVITGAKDHYVKCYELWETSGNFSPTTALEPPHMDGVESLAISTKHNALFSGSRDKSIKKWELSSKNLIKPEYQAHQSWVCALDIVSLGHEEMLVSGGRSGMLKLWDVESLSVQGDIRAHSDTINCVASNKDLVFSASSDRTIKVWRVTE